MTNETLDSIQNFTLKVVLQNSVCFLTIVSLEKQFFLWLYLIYLPFVLQGFCIRTACVTKCGGDDDVNWISRFTNFLLKARTHLPCGKGLSAGTDQMALTGPSPFEGTLLYTSVHETQLTILTQCSIRHVPTKVN